MSGAADLVEDRSDDTGRDDREGSDCCNNRNENSEDDREDGKYTDDNRFSRYVDDKISSNDTMSDLKPFYSGHTLDTRVIGFRDGLMYIRSHWEEFETFVINLKSVLFADGLMNFDSEETEQNVERLLSKRRDMFSHNELREKKVSYEAIKVYTSSEGYSKFYGHCNRISRQENSAGSRDVIRALAFLWELISVDLHNYCVANPHKENYEGVVYRGQIVTEQEMNDFRSLKSCPISQRSMAVPLEKNMKGGQNDDGHQAKKTCLISSTKNIDVAKKFINKLVKDQKTTSKEKMHPMLYKIHVIGLKPDYADLYTSTVPFSYITSLYAVDIEELSKYPSEREVLLRAPFFQVLDIYQDRNLLDVGPCEIIEAVMVNSDRDYKSTIRLGEEERDQARNMMKYMAENTRYEFAEKYCIKKDYLNEARAYAKLFIDNKEKLTELFGPKQNE